MNALPSERPPGRAGRGPLDPRPIEIQCGYLAAADGSALFAAGRTRVLCAASLVAGVPGWRLGSGRGWATAEYAMLPASTRPRQGREGRRGPPSGRTLEIQRMIGRAVRAVLDLDALGENTLALDCDVLDADGSTRAASINGAFLALACAVIRLLREGRLAGNPVRQGLAAVSAGRLGGEIRIDLDYEEDVAADVDLTAVFAADGRLVDLQGTSEGEPFSRADLDGMLDAAWDAATGIRRLQDEAIRRFRAGGRGA